MPKVLPNIPNYPPQGIQALLDKVYLWNPDVSNELISKVNELLATLGDAAGAIKPYTELVAPIAKYVPCYYGEGVYVANKELNTIPAEFNEADWILIATISGGDVASVNGKTGEVVLAAEDINVTFAEEETTLQMAVDTLKEDQGQIGDQVQGIEEKIPEAASAENQLLDTASADLKFLPLAGGEMTGAVKFNRTATTVGADLALIAAQTADGLKPLFGAKTDDNGVLRDVAVIPKLTGDTLAYDDIRAGFIGNTNNVVTRIHVKKITSSGITDAITIPAKAGTFALAEDIAESVTTKDLTVGTEEGTLNIGITAGVATIATNNGLDIVSQTKFDTAPTTDDTTAWADVNSTALVTKQQVASALGEAGSTVTIRNWA